MIQCKDCEFCQMGPENQRIFKCDPFSNIKEPECLAKWQLLRLDMLAVSYRTMLDMQQKASPIQDKILKYIQRELNDIDETDRWKIDEEDNPDPDQPL